MTSNRDLITALQLDNTKVLVAKKGLAIVSAKKKGTV